MSGGDSNDLSSDQSKLLAAQASELLVQGKAEIQSGNFAVAHGLLARLLTDFPNHSEGLYFFAVAQRFEGQFEGALASLQQLIDMEPNYGRAWQRGDIRFWPATIRPALSLRFSELCRKMAV